MILKKEQIDDLRKRFRMGFIAKNSPLIEELNELQVGEGLVVGLDEISPTMIRLGAARINRFFQRYNTGKKFSSRRLRGVQQVTYIREA